MPVSPRRAPGARTQDVMFNLIHKAMQSSHEHEELLRALQHMVEHHPCAVNARNLSHNKSLLHHTCEMTNRPTILEMLLNSHTRIGLQPTEAGHTLLSAALATGRHQSLHIVLRALVEGKLGQNLSDTIVSDLFITLAHTRPREFLNLIVNMPLQTEPEVFSEGVYESVTLPYMLIIGSEHRCPQGIWDDKLVSLQKQQQQLYSQRLADEFSEMSLQMMHKQSGGVHVQQGFRKTHLSAVQAFRVPFERIAGELQSPTSVGQTVSPLQLICAAAAVTQNYAVFGSKTLNILLQFKWHGFAKGSFMWECLGRVCQAVTFAVFNFAAGVRTEAAATPPSLPPRSCPRSCPPLMPTPDAPRTAFDGRPPVPSRLLRRRKRSCTGRSLCTG
jgi:hypothetical protein